ncbi:MAG: ribulose-phosphate 3-epimerase [bacterium]|nr:ribulose-phosphate 3-epimerase [bacterium]
MTQIIPAILTDSSVKFKELVSKLESLTDRIHFDIADGDFVPNKTIKGYDELKEMASAVKFDIHLMVKKPQDQLENWFQTNADRFIIHAESDVDLGAIIKDVKEHKKKVGLALNPETNVEQIESYFNDVDFVQFMTIHPGFQSQQFLNEVVDKVAVFHNKYPDIIIMCDGGITPETAPKLVRAGASVLVSGSYIVKSEDVRKAIQELRNSL